MRCTVAVQCTVSESSSIARGNVRRCTGNVGVVVGATRRVARPVIAPRPTVASPSGPVSDRPTVAPDIQHFPTGLPVPSPSDNWGPRLCWGGVAFPFGATWRAPLGDLPGRPALGSPHHTRYCHRRGTPPWLPHPRHSWNDVAGRLSPGVPCWSDPAGRPPRHRPAPGDRALVGAGLRPAHGYTGPTCSRQVARAGSPRDRGSAINAQSPVPSPVLQYRRRQP